MASAKQEKVPLSADQWNHKLKGANTVAVASIKGSCNMEIKTKCSMTLQCRRLCSVEVGTLIYCEAIVETGIHLSIA